MNGWALVVEIAIQLLFPFVLPALLVKQAGPRWRTRVCRVTTILA